MQNSKILWYIYTVYTQWYGMSPPNDGGTRMIAGSGIAREMKSEF